MTKKNSRCPPGGMLRGALICTSLRLPCPLCPGLCFCFFWAGTSIFIPSRLLSLCLSFFCCWMYRKTARPTQQEVLPLEKKRKKSQQDKERLIVLRYVKASTVLGFQPLDWMENPERRLTMDLMGEGYFRTEALSARRVREYPVESVCGLGFRVARLRGRGRGSINCVSR